MFVQRLEGLRVEDELELEFEGEAAPVVCALVVTRPLQPAHRELPHSQGAG